VGRGKSQHSLDLVQAAQGILAEIQPCSVRAVCYRLFSMGMIASMKKGETDKVSRLLTRAREDGIIPWSHVVDETRRRECPSMWKDAGDYIDTCKKSFRRDHWLLQPLHVEVWSEKSTVKGSIAPVLDAFGVPFRPVHGYTSATAVHDAAAECAGANKPWVILYIGDHDPSGMHMSMVDLPRRLEKYGAQNFELLRLALTRDDVEAGNLLSFPLASKRKDPRHRWYKETTRSYATGLCWELDALSPVVLRNRLEAAIRAEIDHAQWERSSAAGAAEDASLTTYFAGWKRYFKASRLEKVF